jgi:hypothetical protein
MLDCNKRVFTCYEYTNLNPLSTNPKIFLQFQKS